MPKRSRFTGTFARIPLAIVTLMVGAGCSDSGTEPPDDAVNCGHILASGVALRSQEVGVASEWDDVVTGSLVTSAGTRIENIQVIFLASDSSAVALPGEDCPDNRLEWEVANPDIATVSAGSTKWAFTVTGVAAGTTTVTLTPMHETHSHYSTEPIPIVVQ